MLTNSSGLQWNQSAAGWTASLAHCSCFVFAVVVVIGCGNCGLWHISRSTAKRLEAVSALRARFCVCMHITSLRQYLVCAALHLRMWKLNLIFCCCFLYSNWSSNRLGLSRNKVETPSRHRHTYTHPHIHNINRQVFIAGVCLKSRYTYQIDVYFLCFLMYVINGDHLRVYVFVGLPRTVGACSGVWVS